MNDVIMLGPLIIPVRLLLLAAAGIAGYAALVYRLKFRGGTDDSKPVLDHFLNTMLIGFLVWKLSPLVLDTSFVIRNPLSLLYFSGGTRGVWLALLYAAASFVYQTRKNGRTVLFYPDAALTFLLAAAGMYGLLRLAIWQGGIEALLIAAAGFGLYALQIRRPLPLGSRRSGNILTLAIILGLLGWGIRDGLQQSPPSAAIPAESGIEIGDVAADFTLMSLDGSPVKLSDYRGKKVLLNFWATWCPPCKAEMPHLEKFHQEAREDGIVVLGVNLTSTEKSADKVTAFVRERELNMPIVLDSEGHASELYEVRAYPTTLIVDSEGIIRKKYQGAISYDTMKQSFHNVK